MRKLRNTLLAISLGLTSLLAPVAAHAQRPDLGILGDLFAARDTAAPAGVARPGVHVKFAAKNSGYGKPYAELIARHAQENRVPVKLAEAIVQIESQFNPQVRNHGAFGLMQIKPQTARGVGFDGPPSELFNPETNLRFGIRYLAAAYRMAGGDTCGTVMRYQSGLGVRHMSRANRVYCAKAKAIIG